MKSITRQKPFEEIEALLQDVGRVFIVGCGTCATMCRTGGLDEVAEMGARLKDRGKLVTGSTVPATTCDDLTPQALKAHGQAIEDAQAILVMSCAFGVQTLGAALPRRVVPAQDTLFIGLEVRPGFFKESCLQCGQCVLGETAGICPVTSCHKGLLNGPCGGTDAGKCEIDRELDCAWTLIYRRLKELDRLDLMFKYHEPKNHQAYPKPGQIDLEKRRSDK